MKHTNKKWHAVEYAGLISIQDTSYYKESNKCNLLDMDYVGRETAEANGKLAAFAPEMFGLLNKALTRLEIINQSNDDWLRGSIRALIQKATE
jgi:hypothetical protein